jgi:hypothetical protein
LIGSPVLPRARSFLIEALRFDHASAATLQLRQSDSIRSDPALASNLAAVAA